MPFINLPASEKCEKYDGRLTVVLLMVFFSLAVVASKDHGIFYSKYHHIYREIGVKSNQILYVANFQVGEQYSFPISAQLCPLFFQPLPINSANKELLMTIKGVGPILAETIVIYRHQYGSIMSIAELSRVSGIGEKRGASLATELVFNAVE
ncbi:MAG: helix-hairpin-helix domain-containing protein [Desulforhopalus sp.]|nr:helix-hairpin-helix domain-containing protein [Desulforhopalus sp.]